MAFSSRTSTVRRLSTFCPAHGLARGDAVAILSANRTEFLAAYFGIMRAGMVAVPVNHNFPRDTIQFML
ncbi:MAG: AMP-binding protein [Bradyrhizobium sp.]|uniref:AMP-binding protein n=1 Tax=Bradyrhizobium sp. TaxID=376 RepID=UPI003D14CE06